MDGISEGGVPPKSCTSVTVTVDKICGAGRGMYGRNGNWIDDNNNFKESRKYNDHNKDDCHHQQYHASRN